MFLNRRVPVGKPPQYALLETPQASYAVANHIFEVPGGPIPAQAKVAEVRATRTISWPQGKVLQFTVQMSTDGTNWVDIGSSGTMGGISPFGDDVSMMQVSIPAAPVRYLRVVVGAEAAMNTAVTVEAK
jgi:hypothetical protein